MADPITDLLTELQAISYDFRQKQEPYIGALLLRAHDAINTLRTANEAYIAASSVMRARLAISNQHLEDAQRLLQQRPENMR